MSRTIQQLPTDNPFSVVDHNGTMHQCFWGLRRNDIAFPYMILIAAEDPETDSFYEVTAFGFSDAGGEVLVALLVNSYAQPLIIRDRSNCSENSQIMLLNSITKD